MKRFSVVSPYLVAVSVFVILSSVFFAPQFDGYSLNQSDVSQYIGMSKEIYDFRQEEKTDPLWTNSAFSGMPAYQISMNNSTFAGTLENFIVFKLFKAPTGYLILGMLSFYVLLLCFGVNPWLGIIGAVAFGFSTINILYLGGGHNTKVHAIALLPGIIGSLVYAYRKNFRVGGLLLCVFICLHLSANHIQETYYLFFLILAIIIFEFYRFYKEHRIPAFIKISTFLLFASILGIIPTMSNLLLTNEYAKYTNRGKSDLTISASQTDDKSELKGLDRDYIKEYSLGYGEIWSLAIPNIKGGASGRLGDFKDKLSDVTPEYKNDIANFPSYWGEQLGTGGAFYFGATIFLLFVLGLVFIKDTIKWAFFAVSILAVFLSWKYSAILDLFIDHMPLFNKFRDTKMMLVLVQISFPLLGLLFLNELFNTQLNKKKLIYSMGATIGLFFLFYILPSLWFSFFNNNELEYFNKQSQLYPQALQQINQIKLDIEQVRIAIFKTDLLRSIFFMILVSGLILLYRWNKIAKHYFILSIGVLVLLDLWMVDKRYLNNDLSGYHWIKTKDKNTPFRPNVADIQILNWEMKDNPILNENINQKISKIRNNEIEKANLAFTTLNFGTDYRVLSLDNPFANASTSYYHKSIGGYHGAKLKRYAELIDFRLNNEYQGLINALKSNNDTIIENTLKSRISALNMLNTKYIIYNPEAAPIRNPYANGSAWIIKDIRVVKNADEEIKTLDLIDPKNTAVVDQSYSNLIPSNYKYDNLAQINLKKYRPNHLIYESNAGMVQVGVFSEIYYKDGWNAYIDGKPSPYFRADFVLRAIAIPEGKHVIEFKFEPKTYSISKKISYAGSVLIVFFALSIALYEGWLFLKSDSKFQLF
jgi:hypothetical protein